MEPRLPKGDPPSAIFKEPNGYPESRRLCNNIDLLQSSSIHLALNMIRRHEGLSLTAYQDMGGGIMVGYGHQLTDDQRARADQYQSISFAEAECLLREDVIAASQVIDEEVTVWLNDHQKAALIDFIFNMGSENFRTSTLLKRINDASSDAKIAKEFMRWDRAADKHVPALERRRMEEVELWNNHRN